MQNDELSCALGWVSIACWVIVYSPQIIENYQLKSGEGLSVLFVITWLIGDLCNLGGAMIAGLLPTVIILAVYYSICDMVLLFQIYYYRRRRRRRGSIPSVVISNEIGEQAPLLHDLNGESKGRHHTSVVQQTARYTLAFIFVIMTGLVAWWTSQSGGEASDSGEGRQVDIIEWRSQLMGYTSAIMYLGARVPQIYKNTKTKCEGLSLALFIFAIAGNAAYVLSICVASMERQHLVANASWIIGSGFTIVFDIVVVCQFFYYRRSDVDVAERNNIGTVP